MDTPNENVTRLVSKVAELLDILIDISAASQRGENDTEIFFPGLTRYWQQVGHIALAAETSPFGGLYHVCALYQAVLGPFASADAAMSPDVQLLLEEWPTLVMAYLEDPSATAAGTALVAHLQNPHWGMPLSAEDATVLQELLLPQTTTATIQEKQEEATAVTPSAHVADHAKAIDPIDAEQIVDDQEAGHLSPSNPDHEVELDETAKELIELLCLEVDELAQTLDALPTDTEGDVWQEFLRDHTETLERFGDGAETIGLQGLQHAITYIRLNLLCMAAQEAPLADSQRQVIMAWPTHVRHYLRAFYDAAAHQALLQHLQDVRWPQPISATDYADLAAMLAVNAINTGTDTQEPRQRHAQLADISLALPDDVSPELLDSLLRDLPQQAADFSAAVQRLTRGTGSLADVDAAQRVAHTLKGAAHTVGVPGVANLTHHLEDILFALTKHQTLPTPLLNQALTTAADCLEAMSEALIGVGAVPPEAETLAVLQDVMDWANMIDAMGIPADDARPAIRETLPGLADRMQTQTEAATRSHVTPAVSGTRMTPDLVDELLRLAGEAMILNGQLTDRLSRTLQQMQTVRTQHHILQQLVLELEQLVDIRGVTSPLLQRTTQEEFDPLEMEQYNELHTLSRRLLEAVTDGREMGQDVMASLTMMNHLLTEQQKVQRENEETVMHTRMVPVKTIVPRLQRSVRQACRLTGKEVELRLKGSETLMDSNVLNSLIDPLMHLLRNAIDHGIERPEERAHMGKPKIGTIALEFAREGTTTIVRCGDDGAGLNYTAIRETALERGLIRDNQQLSEDELGRLILQPGFSTRSLTTQVSGRGIGMDAVYDRVQTLKGSLHLTSTANKGCGIELKLPVTLMSMHGLLIRSGQDIVAVSDWGIEQILYPGAGQLGQIGNKLTYQMDESIFEATLLQDLLNAGSEPQSQPALQPALLVREASGKNRVVIVQEVLDSQTLVVKNLGVYVPTLKGIIGATILGDGRVAAVIDLPDLLRDSARTAPRQPQVRQPQLRLV